MPQLDYDSSELLPLILEIKRILPQLANFIQQFNSYALDNDIETITGIEGNLEMFVPSNMSDHTIDQVKGRLGILDRLINTQGNRVVDLFKQAEKIEQGLKLSNPNYTLNSELQTLIRENIRLNGLFKH
jgi:glutaredoxin-related protein